MLTLYIFKSNSRGMQYGIGTYITELIQALLYLPDINIFLVSYKNIEHKEFSVKIKSERFTEIIIPDSQVHSGNSKVSEKRYASLLVKLLSGFIPRNEKVVFQINYIDDLSIAVKLKESFDYPIISMVHFAQWQQIFEGNRQKLSGLNIDEPTNNIEFTLSTEKEMYKIADHVVSVTQYMKDFLVNQYGISSEKISVVPNGLDYQMYGTVLVEEKAEIKERLGFNKDDIIILFSGRIDPCKGVLFLMEAFEEACKQNPNLRLVLLGQGSIEDCQKRLQSVFGKVTYTGFIQKDLVLSFYQVADIGIVPSLYDHCPYTVLEMIANQIPMIVSNINGLDELLSEEGCLFINPVLSKNGDLSFNIKELSNAMLKLAEDKNLREVLAKNSNKNFKKKHASSRMAEEMNNIFLLLTKNDKKNIVYEKI